MKLFECQNCGQLVYFENTRCERCGMALGYLPDPGTLTALEAQEDGSWKALVPAPGPLRYCANEAHAACNWLVPADGPDTFCPACRHNHTVPDLAVPENLARWQKLEVAKRRLIYTLIALRLPRATRAEDPEHGLAFDFLADVKTEAHAERVMTGHASGLITINIAEADDAERERIRTEMGEPFRTLLGHFRHEIGHWYWDMLVADQPVIDEFRAIFGDERADYGEALAANYRDGPPPGWQENFVSTYAASHPWEDFAETWAHYLHIVDALETAAAFGLRIRPVAGDDLSLATRIDFDPHHAATIERLIEAWLPLAFAVNSLNRSLGQPDLYPFVLSPQVIAKLGFVHGLIHPEARAAPPAPPPMTPPEPPPAT